MLLVFNQDYIKGSCVAVLQFFFCFCEYVCFARSDALMCVLNFVMCAFCAC